MQQLRAWQKDSRPIVIIRYNPDGYVKANGARSRIGKIEDADKDPIRLAREAHLLEVIKNIKFGGPFSCHVRYLYYDCIPGLEDYTQLTAVLDIGQPSAA